LAVAAFFAVGMLAVNASATTVTLSDVSSAEGTMTAASMDATVEFLASGNTLTINVLNTSSNPIRMSEILFNSGNKNITLTSTPTHSGSGDPLWELSSNAVSAGFGTFDYGLVGIKVGGGPNAEFGEILAGGSAQFTFNVNGNGWDVDTFAGDLSTGGAFVAARFHPNGGNSSAYGAAVPVPEPSTAALMALGLIGLTQLGRRRN
jgi:hypothetical protein